MKQKNVQSTKGEINAEQIRKIPDDSVHLLFSPQQPGVFRSLIHSASRGRYQITSERERDISKCKVTVLCFQKSQRVVFLYMNDLHAVPASDILRIWGAVRIWISFLPKRRQLSGKERKGILVLLSLYERPLHDT